MTLMEEFGTRTDFCCCIWFRIKCTDFAVANGKSG